MRDEFQELLDAADGASDVPTEIVDVDTRELKAALRIDFEFFIEFFLADTLDMDVPEFHKEIWGLLTDLTKERVLLAIPRDHAKTTLAKLAVIWYWLFTPHRFCVYLSNTNPIAKGACKDIAEFLKHPNFVAVFGEVKVIKESENESLWMYDLAQGNGRPPKRLILRAIGQGQQMRGINIDNQRPDITVIDDVEDNENTDSTFQQKKLDKWIFGPFLKALARKKKILWLGNMLSKTCLLARLSRMSKWNPVVFGCLVKNATTTILEPLWPGKWTIDALKDDLKEYKDLGLVESWMCEMMNMPGHGENGFALDQIRYAPLPTPDGVLAAWITVDPAFGQKADNDETSIAVHVIPKSGVPMTVCVEHGRFDEFVMFEKILALATYWNAWTWGIEAIAAQKVLISLFSVLLARNQLKSRVEMIPLMAGKGDPKVSRIRSFVSLMANDEWAIPEGDIDITWQITNYDTKKTDQEDDIIDSCAYGPMMMQNHLSLIMAQASGIDLFAGSRAQVGMEVAGV